MCCQCACRNQLYFLPDGAKLMLSSYSSGLTKIIFMFIDLIDSAVFIYCCVSI